MSAFSFFVLIERVVYVTEHMFFLCVTLSANPLGKLADAIKPHVWHGVHTSEFLRTENSPYLDELGSGGVVASLF